MKKIANIVKSDKDICYKFLNTGLACYALCALDSVGILDNLLNGTKLEKSSIATYNNPSLIQAALITLLKEKIIYFSADRYSLTELGKIISKNIGIITLPFVGYRKLFGNQPNLLNNPHDWDNSDIDFSAVARSSINFGKDDLDPILLDVIKLLSPTGTVCDLGCGTGEKLLKICSELKVHGLGIEKSLEVINDSENYITSTDNVEIMQGDITAMDGVWEDIEIVITSFVFHDIFSEEDAINFINSTRKHFPCLRYFVIVDIVSYSIDFPNILPGFEYVHGLQGVSPRSCNDNHAVFSKSNFDLLKEIEVSNMPNTFIWVLTPNKSGPI